MRISDNGITLIKHFEGIRRNPYRDCVGLWTVGVGHLIGDGKSLPDSWNRTFTDDEVDAILRNDLVRFEHGVTKFCPVNLTQNEFDSLVCFSFNLGLGVLQRSTLRQKILRNDKKGAAEEILKYNKAGGKIIKGLVTRRQAEYKLFLQG
jgi:GH24 family phage-related lysozyme (muramidase)